MAPAALHPPCAALLLPGFSRLHLLCMMDANVQAAGRRDTASLTAEQRCFYLVVMLQGP